MTAIYTITNTVNGRVYVGSTFSFKKRKQIHLTALRGGYGINRLLQADFTKFGQDSFVFKIILRLTKKTSIEDMANIERQFIDDLKPFYNVRTITHRHKCTTEAKQKLSESLKSHWGSLSAEEKKTKNAYKVGRVFTEETREKLSERAKARVWSEEVKQKISDSLKGKTYKKRVIKR